RAERGEPELAIPADLTLAGDSRPGAEHRRHRPERGEPDHVIEGRGETAAAEVRVVPVRPRDEEVEDQREAQREDEEAPVAERAQELEAGVGDPAHAASSSVAVSWRNASSRPAPLISMSRASG